MQGTSETEAKKAVMCAPIINHTLKSEMTMALHLSLSLFELCSTHYTTLQMNNRIRNFSVMNPENVGEMHYKASGKPYCAITN